MTKVRTQTGSFAYAKYQLRRSILENALETDYTTEDYEASLKFFEGCAFCGANQAQLYLKLTRKTIVLTSTIP